MYNNALPEHSDFNKVQYDIGSRSVRYGCAIVYPCTDPVCLGCAMLHIARSVPSQSLCGPHSKLPLCKTHDQASMNIQPSLHLVDQL